MNNKATRGQTQAIRNMMLNRKLIVLVQRRLDDLRVEWLNELSFEEAKTLINQLVTQLNGRRV